MKCIICGRESGTYQYCKECYSQIKVKNNGGAFTEDGTSGFIYERKQTLITRKEQGYYNALLKAVPEGFRVFPQINLAAFIERTDGSRFHNELFRNVDFLITDDQYCPRIAVEVNDQSHMNNDRIERDKKVHDILEEAGIPLMKLWTSYGVNPGYIEGQVQKLLEEVPVRVHHALPAEKETEAEKTADTPLPSAAPIKKKKEGCYIATCVYGSYDCPEVMVLRSYRDNILAKTWYGRLFIKVYYAVSPVLVRWFGKKEWFTRLWKPVLGKKVEKLESSAGYSIGK